MIKKFWEFYVPKNLQELDERVLIICMFIIAGSLYIIERIMEGVIYAKKRWWYHT